MKPSFTLSVVLMGLTFGSLALGQPTRPARTPPKLRLGDAVRPRRQALELTVVPSQETFAGVADIDVDFAVETAVFWLNGRDLTINEASLAAGGAVSQARILRGDDDLIGFSFDRPVRPGPGYLGVAYTGVLNRKDNLGLFVQQDGGEWYAFSQFEPLGARRAFPSFDEPSFKIPWTVKLRVPKDVVALSNTPESGSSAGADGLKTVSFRETPPMPSYLVAIAVGPFDLVEAGRAGRQHTPVRIVTPRSRTADARWAASTTPVILKLLEDYFDIPYPYAKLDLVAVPITVGFSAMENAGLVTFRQSILLRKPEDENVSSRRSFAEVCAHELAHMWLGDLVTAAWWDDIWLNEAFASWMKAKVIEKWKPEWDANVGRITSRGRAMSADSLSTARRIRQSIESNNDIVSAFDPITYSKGEAILEMFEAWVGEDTFRRGVHQYLLERSWQNATARDFLATLSAAAARDVATPFSTFLEQTGVPVVSAELVCSPGRPHLLLSQRPYRPTGSKDNSAKIWQIPVCVESSGTLGRRKCILLTDTSTDLPLEESTCPDRIHPNAQGAGYYRVAYRGDLLLRLLKDGGAHLSLVDRVSLVQDVSALVHSGDLKVGEALAMVPALLKGSDRHVVSATASLVRSATQNGELIPSAERPRLARFVRAMYGEQAAALGWTAKAGEDEDTRLLRASVVPFVSNLGQDPGLGKEAVRLASLWVEDSKAIDADIVAPVLSAATWNGDRRLFERFHDEAKKEKDPFRRQRLLASLGSFRERDLASDALPLVLDDRFDPRESLTVLLGLFREPQTRDIANGFLRQHFDAISSRLPQEGRTYLLFAAAGICDAEHKADFEAFFTPRVAQFPGAPRALAQHLEEIDLCAAFRGAQQTSAVRFLEAY